MSSNKWTALIAGTALAGIVLTAFYLLAEFQPPPGLVRKVESPGTAITTSPPDARTPIDDDEPARRAVADSVHAASNLLDDLLFGSDVDSRKAQIRLAGLHAAQAIDGQATIGDAISRLCRDLAAADGARFQNPGATAQTLVALSATGSDAIAQPWLEYREMPTSATAHRRLRELLVDWPWGAEQIGQIEELVKELLAISDAETLLARCHHLFGGSAAEREAIVRALDRMLANSRTEAAETVLAAFVQYGDADRDLRALSMLFSGRQAQSGQTELNPALMHAAQTLCLTMQGKQLGVGTPPPPTNRAQWLSALLAGTDAMTDSTGSALLAAIGLAAAEDAPGALDAYGSLLDGTTNPLVRETIIVNLGRVASYEDLRRLCGSDLLTDLETDRGGEQLAFITAILNLRQRHPHLAPRIAQDIRMALETWRRDARLHDRYWRLLELLAFSPLSDVTPTLRTIRESGDDPFPDSLEKAYRACEAARN